MNPSCRRERGAVLVITAVSMVALLIITAIVIDIGFTRRDRRAIQLAVDNAITSAGQVVIDSDVATGCVAALDFLELTLDSGSFQNPADCASAFSGACDPATERTATFTSGQYTVTIHQPVTDASALMVGAGTIGAPAVAASADDGTPCARIGIRLQSQGPAFFGNVVGSGDRSTTVHAVARTVSDTEFQRLNLLVLERRDCQALDISGQGTVIVDGPDDPEIPGQFLPGITGVDSDASGTCGGQAATLEASGQARLQANGPCPGPPFPMEACASTGEILLRTPAGDPTCETPAAVPACTEGANADITPDVRHLNRLFTRSPVDHRFNCKADYSGEPWASAPLSQPIAGCTDAHTAYLDGLKTFVAGLNPATLALDDGLGNLDGWYVVQGAECSSGSPATYPPIVPGNVYVNCGDYKVDDVKNFTGGNVVFSGDITMNSGSSSLTINACAVANVCTSSLTWTDGQPFDYASWSNGAAWMYVAGEMKFTGGSFRLQETAVVLGPSSGVETTGSNPTWIAPSEGPFQGLALWSESTGSHRFAGNGALDLRGVYFVGQSALEYTGQADQVLDEAQFIANRMVFGGQGTVTLSPTADGVEFPIDIGVELIR